MHGIHPWEQQIKQMDTYKLVAEELQPPQIGESSQLRRDVACGRKTECGVMVTGQIKTSNQHP